MFDTEILLRFSAALAAVIGLILGVAWLTRLRRGGTGGGLLQRAPRRLSVVETLPIDNRTRIALLRCDDREYLLAFGANGVTPIPGALPAASLPPPAPARLPEIATP
jgi:flagellar biogenesis protein FliO